MDAAGCCVNAVVVAIQSEQLPVCGSEIVDDYRKLESVSNLKDMDGAAVATSLPRDQPINHESQIFVRTCNRSIILNVNLASESVQEVKRHVEEREGIPVSEQHLIFGGKPLRDGTFLRDYDALGHQCTLNVFARIRGGNWTSRDMTLSDLVGNPPSAVLMTGNESIPVPQPQAVQVLTEVGGRILHGVLTCILSAHRAGLSFNGACGMDKLWVHVYNTGATEADIVVSRVYVRDRGDDELSSSLVKLEGKSQKADYKALSQVMEVLFHDEKSKQALHVGSIYKLLQLLAADESDDPAGLVTKGMGPVRRTHLLQAYAAMISSPVAVSTMCLNLKRFFDHLDGNRKTTFQGAMGFAKHKTRPLDKEVPKQPLFENVYKHPPSNQNNNSSGAPSNQNDSVDSSVLDTPYEGSNGLLNFARNWFAHVPQERWVRDGGTQRFQELPQLDNIFTYHFPEFIPQALLQLYKELDDEHSNRLTRVLVTLA